MQLFFKKKHKIKLKGKIYTKKGWNHKRKQEKHEKNRQIKKEKRRLGMEK
jgi:hypothetical protein